MRLRRALHQAVDLILDAWEEESAEKKPKTRGQRPIMPMPSDMPPEVIARVEEQMGRRGFKRAS